MTRTTFFTIFFATLIHLILPLSAAAEGPEGVPEPRYMFVTSATGNGDLGSWPESGGATGLIAGDTICRTLALQQGLPNAIEYRAWLSDFFNDAFCRIRGFGGLKSNNCGQAFLSANGPWTRLDGVPFSGDLFALIANGPLTTAIIDETGQPTTLDLVYSGTNADGTRQPNRCLNWTSNSASEYGEGGTQTSTYNSWTQNSQISCALAVRLMCFDPGLPADPLAHETEPAGLVFVTSAQGNGDLSSWPLAGGLNGTAGADAVCRQSAAAAGLPFPQSYVAWLSAPGDSVVDALPADLPWRRLDGVRVADSLSDLTRGALQAPINVDEQGIYGATSVWTGTYESGQPTGSHCSEWSSADSNLLAHRGFSNRANYQWSRSSLVYCDQENHGLYCFSTVVATPDIFADGFESGDTFTWD